jgi:hypothetical protein
MKSKIEMILDEACGVNNAKWKIDKGTLLITREGYKPLKFRALGHEEGVDLETPEGVSEILWKDLERGVYALHLAIRNMAPERPKRVRWNLMDTTLTMMAIRERHPDTSGWKNRIDPEIRSMLEVFPEFEQGEGIMSPCPAMWLEISISGWASVPDEAPITQERPSVDLKALVNWVSAAERQVGDTMVLGLPLREAEGGPWGWKAQVHFVRKWLRINPLLWLVIWEKVDRSTMAEAVSGLTSKEVEPLIKAVKEVQKKDPMQFQKLSSVWGL